MIPNLSNRATAANCGRCDVSQKLCEIEGILDTIEQDLPMEEYRSAFNSIRENLFHARCTLNNVICDIFSKCDRAVVDEKNNGKES